MNNEWLNTLRSRMDDHEEDVPDGLWDDIKDELFPEEESNIMAGFIPMVNAEDEKEVGKEVSKKGHKSLFYRIGGIAAAVVVLFTLMKIWATDDKDRKLSQKQTNNKSLEGISTVENLGYHEKISMEGELGPGTSLAQNKWNIIPSGNGPKQAIPQYIWKNQANNDEDVPSMLKAPEVGEEAHPKKQPQEMPLAHDPTDDQTNDREMDEVFKEKRKAYADISKNKAMKRSDGKWMLGMLTGNGGTHGAEQQFPGYASINGKPMDVEEVWSASEFVDDPLTQILLANQSKPVEAKIRHKVPVTFGLSVYHSLGKRWGIGTGLNYTKLSSELHSGSSDNYIKGEQTVHYVGIPVQVNYNVIQKGKFTGYVTGGALVEKPVSGSISTTYVVNDEVKETSTERLENKPLQFSVNTAVGLQLKVMDRFGIYAEPGIGYHFKNENSPNTIYKEKPLHFNVKFGIRLLID